MIRIGPTGPVVLAAGETQPAISHGCHDDFPKTEGTTVFFRAAPI